MLEFTEGDGRVVQFHDIDDPFFIEVFPQVAKHSITAGWGPLPMWALYKSIKHIVKHNIPGDIAECGVWNGGSMLLAALALRHLGDTSRKIYLYDTYDGMPEPDPTVDFGILGESAHDEWKAKAAEGKKWGFGGTLEMVQAVMAQAGYPEENLVFVKGMVEDTIPGVMSDQLALLRLDTDLYSSTYHEMTYLYPTLVSGGILILDDYGVFKGAREAVDQYVDGNYIPIFLMRVDGAVHIAVKP